MRVSLKKLSAVPKLFVGTSIGRLVVIAEAPKKNYSGKLRKTWLCQCSCGTELEVLDQSLRSGATASCGCLAKERTSEKFFKHGHSSNAGQSKTYRAWRDMWQRCTNRNLACYKNYGGRGISVDPSWASFEKFLADMGTCPEGLTLDRVDVNKGYEKSNCAWATWATQATHKRSGCTQMISFNGETLSPSAWAEKLKISLSTIYGRRKKGWPPKLVLSPFNQRIRGRYVTK